MCLGFMFGVKMNLHKFNFFNWVFAFFFSLGQPIFFATFVTIFNNIYKNSLEFAQKKNV